MKTPDLMLFEPNLGGHHAEFTCHILKSWLQDGDRGRLVAAVTAGLLEQQPGLSFGLNAPPQTSVAPLADPTPGNARSLWRKAIRNRDLLAAAIRRHRPKRVLAMYFDHLQLGMATGLRFPFPVEISGILFHPTLHYRSPDKLNARHAFQNLRKRLLLHAVARNPHLKTVFTLDPSAVPSLRRLGLNAIALPDPVTATIVSLSSQIELRNRLSIPQDRQVMLLFGALTSRKGVIQTLEALCLLEPVKARGLVLLMAGPLDPELQEDADRLSVLARSKGTLIIHHKSFRSESVV